MLSMLFSFLGGSTFRMLWGEVSHYFTTKQANEQELAVKKLEGDLAAAEHARNLESLRLQSELGIKEVQVKGEMEVQSKELDAFLSAVNLTGQKTGIAWVDAWNGCVRPLLATECIVLWSLHLSRHGWTLDDPSWAIMSAVLGIFVADRALLKRGK